jgi:Flp pilus assembly protein TadD
MSTMAEAVTRLVETGNLDDAEKLLAATLALGETAELWNDWATVQCSRGQLGQAEQGYRRALQLNPEEKQPALNLAALLLAQGRLDESVPVLQSLAGRMTEDEKEALRRLAVPTQPAAASENRRDAEPKNACESARP